MGNRITGHFCGKMFITGHNEGYPKRDVARAITQKLHRRKQKQSKNPPESAILEDFWSGLRDLNPRSLGPKRLLEPGVTDGRSSFAGLCSFQPCSGRE